MLFTNGYQIKLLALLSLDKELALSTTSYLSDDFFSTFATKSLYQVLTTYLKQYKTPPTITVFEVEALKFQTLIEEQPLLEEFFALLHVGYITEREYIKDSIKQFIHSRQLKLAFNKNSDIIDNGEYGKFIEVLKSEYTDLTVLDNIKSLPTFDLNNLQEIYDQQQGMRTGFPIIDECIGGLMLKELMCLLADTNVGKSLAMCAIGSNLVKNRYKTLHVTLEMSVARTLIRYFTSMCEPVDNITYNNIHRFEPSEHVFNYIQKLRDNYEGLLFVEELPTGKGTISDIYRLYEKYKPQVIIVDYLDLLGAIKKRDARRFELADLTVALRGLAVETNTTILTATQTSRAGANTRIINKELVAEDYEKMRVCDTVIGLGQNKNDASRHEVVFNITKSRNTEKDRAERYFINFDTMKFSLMRREELYNDNKQED